jgi:NTE family protein
MADIPPDALTAATSPVVTLPHEEAEATPAPGVALCLSGGGYRAMLFHLGSLWRLNEAGWLPKLDRISSVSGGSITAGLLALKWPLLAFDHHGVSTAFQQQVVAPIRTLAGRTIDATAILGGVFGPGRVSDKVIGAYRQWLFGHATLQDLPDHPRFVFNATNVQSGVLWRFMKPYMRDYRVGEVKRPRVDLAIAVAASSAFPPVLSPVTLELDSADFTPNSGTDLQREPYTTQVVLSDGGVYDNLGLETAWKRYQTILVSDAGGQLSAEPEPEHDWIRHAVRILALVDHQVRSLRKRQVIDAYKRGLRQGAYWGIRTDITQYGLRDHLLDSLTNPLDHTLPLADLPTRLTRVDSLVQERVINWGYAVCDAALRAHVDPTMPRPRSFPYPDSIP